MLFLLLAVFQSIVTTFSPLDEQPEAVSGTSAQLLPAHSPGPATRISQHLRWMLPDRSKAETGTDGFPLPFPWLLLTGRMRNVSLGGKTREGWAHRCPLPCQHRRFCHRRAGICHLQKLMSRRAGAGSRTGLQVIWKVPRRKSQGLLLRFPLAQAHSGNLLVSCFCLPPTGWALREEYDVFKTGG